MKYSWVLEMRGRMWVDKAGDSPTELSSCPSQTGRSHGQKGPGTDRQFRASCEHEGGATLTDCAFPLSEAHTPALLGTLRKTWSQIEPGVLRGRVWRGRAGQAFELAELGMRDGATANSSPQTTTGHKQDDQIVKTKPPARSCSRVLDQSLGSTRAH